MLRCSIFARIYAIQRLRFSISNHFGFRHRLGPILHPLFDGGVPEGKGEEVEKKEKERKREPKSRVHLTTGGVGNFRNKNCYSA